MKIVKKSWSKHGFALKLLEHKASRKNKNYDFTEMPLTKLIQFSVKRVEMYLYAYV